jgi:cell division protein FtsW (lipid II flippase)
MKKRKYPQKKRFDLRWRKPDLHPRWLITSWIGLALLAGAAFIIARWVAMALGSQEEIFAGMRTDVFFLPACAAVLAALSRQPGRDEGARLVAIVLFAGLAFFGVGLVVNDLGLLWLGAMAVIFCLPFVSPHPRWAAAIAIAGFAVIFLSPKVLPTPFLKWLEGREGTSTIGRAPNDVSFRDELQVRRDRDHYRMLDTVQSDLVERIPSQLAREVVLDRERVRYQAMNGAWRDGLRASGTAGSPWLGSGYLQSKPIVGHTTFRDAARSDYVYPLYVRSEFGLIGLGALVLVYAVLFVIAPARGDKPGAPTRLGLWSLAIAAGTALFMIGGTSALYPFSGKWPLMLSIGSSSDLALGLALMILGAMEVD